MHSRKKSIQWTTEEDTLLISLALHLNRRWSKICKNFENKTRNQCYLRYLSINPSIKKGLWEPAEDQKLLEGVSLYGKKWSKIAKACFSNRTSKQIRERYMNYLYPEVKNGKFSLDEEIRILELHNRFGNRWKLISQFVPGRSSDAIKNRFNSSIKRNKRLFRVLISLNCKIVSICLLLNFIINICVLKF
jgi:myb proto-oncogene protein